MIAMTKPFLVYPAGHYSNMTSSFVPTAQTIGVKTGSWVTPLPFNYPIRIFISHKLVV